MLCGSGCIGYRFALLEIKTILATLIEAFEFLERDEAGTRIVSTLESYDILSLCASLTDA